MHPAAQPGQRLQQVQRGRQQAQPQPAGRRERLPEGNPKGRAGGLQDGGADGQPEQGQGQPQRTPESSHARQRRKDDDEQVPLRHHGEGLDQARGGLVERLVWSKPPGAMIDASRAPTHIAHPVDSSCPGEMAGGVVFLRPFPLQQRFRPAVSLLLLPVGSNRIAAMMPDQGRRVEAHRPASLLQAPAEVHIIAGDGEPAVESADGLQAGLSNGHVAARNVLRHAVGKEHVRRTSRGAGDTIRDRPVIRWGNVGPPHRGEPDAAPGKKAGGHVRQPVRIGIGVIVYVSDDLSHGGFHPGVAGAAQAPVLGADDAEAVLPGDRRRPVGRAVVHDDHLVVRIVEPAQAFAAIPDGAGPVVAANDHRDAGPGGVGQEGGLGVRLADDREGRLGTPLPVRDAELPVGDIAPAPIPFVRPGVGEHAGAAPGEGGPDLPVQRLRLGGLTMAVAVQTDLGHHERALPRDVVEARHVGLEIAPRFQIDVEAEEIEERKPQVLGRRVIHVADEAGRVLLLGRVV